MELEDYREQYIEEYAKMPTTYELLVYASNYDKKYIKVLENIDNRNGTRLIAPLRA